MFWETHLLSQPASLDPLQLAYRSNLSTDDANAFTLHTALSHLENKNTYVRMLFVDYSSAFNTIVPATLVAKLQTWTSYMVCSQRCSAEEDTSEPLLPETAEEVWNEPQNPQVLLHLHCGEHPDRLHHRLVWKQHRWQPQSSAKGRANCPPHCWRWASLPPGYLHQAVYKESPEDYQRLQPPVPQSALSAALRKTSPQHPIPHYLTEG